MGVLDSLNVLEQTVGLDKYPEYNSMIIFETWKDNGKYFVKVFYKKEEITAEDHELIDVTKFVRNCKRERCLAQVCFELLFCHSYIKNVFQDFLDCCDDYRNKGEAESCEASDLKIRTTRSSPPNNIRRDLHVSEFSGPE